MKLIKKSSDDFFSHYKPVTLKGFKEFHKENPQVYKRFLELAFEMKATGRKKYSSKLIINVMRWERDLKTGSKPFKINDRWQSIYGRMAAYHYPELSNFFEFRKRKHSKNDFLEEDYV